MLVIASYTPTMDDELPVKIGEIVRMLEQFEDGWCLVQRLGKTDEVSGVCPGFCLQEPEGTTTSTTLVRAAPAID